MRTLYNLPDGDVEDINKKVASQVFDDDHPNKSYLTISQVWSLSHVIMRGEEKLIFRRQMRNWRLLIGSRTPSTARGVGPSCRISVLWERKRGEGGTYRYARVNPPLYIVFRFNSITHSFFMLRIALSVFLMYL